MVIICVILKPSLNPIFNRRELHFCPARFLKQHKAHTDLLSSLDADLAQLSRIGLHPALRVRQGGRAGGNSPASRDRTSSCPRAWAGQDTGVATGGSWGGEAGSVFAPLCHLCLHIPSHLHTAVCPRPPLGGLWRISPPWLGSGSGERTAAAGGNCLGRGGATLPLSLTQCDYASIADSTSLCPTSATTTSPQRRPSWTRSCRR